MPIEVICGPMFSGKTEELIRRISRAKYAKQNVLAVKPSIDNRYSSLSIMSHSGAKEPCLQIDDIQSLEELCKSQNYSLIAIEEGQFFDQKSFLEAIDFLRRNSLKTIIAGLDMDFMGNPFENILYSMGIAEKVDKLSAVCVICAKDATMTYKKTINEKRVEVGEADIYEARCYKCWSDRNLKSS